MSGWNLLNVRAGVEKDYPSLINGVVPGVLLMAIMGENIKTLTLLDGQFRKDGKKIIQTKFDKINENITAKKNYRRWRF